MEIAFENHYDGEIRQRLSTAKSRKDLNEIAFLIDQNLVVMTGARTSMNEAADRLEEIIKKSIERVGEEILVESFKLNIKECSKNILSSHIMMAKTKHLEYNIMFLDEREKIVEEREKQLKSLESQYREMIKGNRNNRKKCSKMIEQNAIIKNEVKDANRQLEELTKASREQYGKIFRLEDDNRRLEDDNRRLEDDNRRLEDDNRRLEDDNRRLEEINKSLTEKKNPTVVFPLKSIEDAEMETDNVVVYRRSNSARVIGRKSEKIELDEGTQRDVDTIHNNNLRYCNE